jgi:hypothetical protein
MASTPKKEKPLTVYATCATWRDERNPNRHQQADFVCASPSKAAIFRRYPDLRNWKWTKTGNERAIETARSKPMALFARGLHDWHAPYFEVMDLDKSVQR